MMRCAASWIASRGHRTPDDDPKHILRTAAGWEMFKSYLHVHHTSRGRAAVAADAQGSRRRLGRDGVARRHGGGARRDRPAARRDRCRAGRPRLRPDAPGGTGRRARDGLCGHLAHEETEGLALIDSIVTAEQWQAFSVEAASGSAATCRGSCRGCSKARPRRSPPRCSPLPAAAQQAYRDEWQPAYAKLRRWG